MALSIHASANQEATVRERRYANERTIKQFHESNFHWLLYPHGNDSVLILTPFLRKESLAIVGGLFESPGISAKQRLLSSESQLKIDITTERIKNINNEEQKRDAGMARKV